MLLMNGACACSCVGAGGYKSCRQYLIFNSPRYRLSTLLKYLDYGVYRGCYTI